ncbi:hypothetical protein Acsp05_26690 [Actinokineospora sp. NBRC 105648]|nr:hypothetical protein Acsp05_26690 [Actinokineospora sp. NBRC 105648]
MSERHTCPSSQAGPGATLLGILGPGGRVVYTPNGPRVTPEFQARLAARGGGPLESRYRFAAPCVESGCVFWDGACRAVDAAHEDFVAVGGALPECGIRETCRWWAQQGPAACAVCPSVRTNGSTS